MNLGDDVYHPVHNHGVIVALVGWGEECDPEEATYCVVQWDEGGYSPLPIETLEPHKEH